MSDQKLFIGRHEQDCKWRFRPASPEMVSQLLTEPECFDESDAIDFTQATFLLAQSIACNKQDKAQSQCISDNVHRSIFIRGAKEVPEMRVELPPNESVSNRARKPSLSGDSR